MTEERGGTAPKPGGYLTDSLVTSFRALYAAILVLAAVWAVSNIRSVPPESRAVVMRLGRVDRVQESGLLLAWPTPIEQVVLLPARTRQIEYHISVPGNDQAAGEGGSQQEKVSSDAHLALKTDLASDEFTMLLRPSGDAENPGYLLTGDGRVVELDATLYFEVTAESAYMTQMDHVRPALRCIYLSSAVALAASRKLDDFLVVRAEGNGTSAAGARGEALRADLVRIMNEQLDGLRRQGGDLGVRIARIDLIAFLPPIAKAAFDAVLTASQTADQNVAAARTDAARISQTADSDSDQILSAARASADERVRRAVSDTAAISTIETGTADLGRSDQILRYYREKMAKIMQKVDVTAIDPRGRHDMILQGPVQ